MGCNARWADCVKGGLPATLVRFRYTGTVGGVPVVPVKQCRRSLWCRSNENRKVARLGLSAGSKIGSVLKQRELNITSPPYIGSGAIIVSRVIPHSEGCSRFSEYSELLIEGSQYITRNMTSKAFVRVTRPTFPCATVL